uniref:Uncharacterized protein n=1 Tax=Caenorhabditis japonica TaxID=281687 RepID=A0A8R1IDS1_CAEJA
MKDKLAAQSCAAADAAYWRLRRHILFFFVPLFLISLYAHCFGRFLSSVAQSVVILHRATISKQLRTRAQGSTQRSTSNCECQSKETDVYLR